MKYTAVVVIALVLLGGAGLYFYSQNQSASESMVKNDDVMLKESGDVMEKTDAMREKSEAATEDGAMDDKTGGRMMSKGSYMPYSQSAFDSAKDKKRVLFFFANWCPTCKPVDAELNANANKIPEGVEIFRVNYNDTETDATDKALAEQYGITYQHTFVQIDTSGNEVAKWNGGGLDKIVSMVK